VDGANSVVYFSVIAVLIALGIVTSMMVKNTESNQNENLVNSVYLMQSQCDYVCNSGTETNLPINVRLPSGSVIYTKDNKICGTLNDNMKCVICSCDLILHAQPKHNICSEGIQASRLCLLFQEDGKRDQHGMQGLILYQTC